MSTDPARRVIVALDFDTADEARAIVDRLGDAGRAYKVGLQLLTAAGPALAGQLAGEGKDVFLDLKLFEIPTSVAAAVRAAGRLGATMVTVHAMGGRQILEAAVRAAEAFPHLRVLALTVVTSLTTPDLADIGLHATVEEQVARLAGLARRSGCHGVIASPQDAAALRAALGPDLLIVTPGVTLPAADPTGTPTEHARPADPATTIRAGASHVIIGRSLTRTPDPSAVLTALHQQLRTAVGRGADSGLDHGRVAPDNAARGDGRGSAEEVDLMERPDL